MGILRVGKKMWDDYWQENWFWEAGWERNSNSVRWKQVVAREKTKFKTKIIRRKNGVRWGKRREGQKMWIELNYTIKSSDLICINLKDKKWMLRSYAGKKISHIMKKTTVAFVSITSCIYHCCFVLFFPESASGNVRCWSFLTIGSLFSTSRDLLTLAVSFNF